MGIRAVEVRGREVVSVVRMGKDEEVGWAYDDVGVVGLVVAVEGRDVSSILSRVVHLVEKEVGPHVRASTNLNVEEEGQGLVRMVVDDSTRVQTVQEGVNKRKHHFLGTVAEMI